MNNQSKFHMSKKSANAATVVAIPPREVDIDSLKDVLRDYLKEHPESAKICLRKQVPQHIEGFVIEAGLSEEYAISDDVFDRYKSMAKEIANLIHEKVTLIPTTIAIQAVPDEQ